MAKPLVKKKLNWGGEGDFAGDFDTPDVERLKDYEEPEAPKPSTRPLKDYEEPNPYAESEDKRPWREKYKIDWSSPMFGSKKAEAKSTSGETVRKPIPKEDDLFATREEDETTKLLMNNNPKPEPMGSTQKSTAPEETEEKPTKTVKTKGGDYPVYGKDSKSAGDFAKAFASARMDARKQGKKVGVFEWPPGSGRKYTTALK